MFGKSVFRFGNYCSHWRSHYKPTGVCIVWPVLVEKPSQVQVFRQFRPFPYPHFFSSKNSLFLHRVKVPVLSRCFPLFHLFDMSDSRTPASFMRLYFCPGPRTHAQDILLQSIHPWPDVRGTRASVRLRASTCQL